jgi:hypothetical protein
METHGYKKNSCLLSDFDEGSWDSKLGKMVEPYHKCIDVGICAIKLT